MTPFTTCTAVAAPLLRDNVDTDAIIPSREIKSVGKTGLEDGLFAGWRYTKIGGREPDPGFILNQPAYRDAQFLLSGTNFGCGSSREHAAWALAEYGFRAVVAPSFNPIFKRNCVRNFVLPALADAGAIAATQAPVTVDLAARQIRAETGEIWTFQIEEEAAAMLLSGRDEIDFTLSQADAIQFWREADRRQRAWAYLPGAAA